MSDALSYLKWYVLDYRADRHVQRMCWKSKGLYRELLDEFWIEGPLPNDMAELADICGCTEAEFTEHWPQIKRHFVLTENGALLNQKMHRMRTEKDQERIKRAHAGKLGGLSRRGNDPIENGSNSHQVNVDIEKNQQDSKQVLRNQNSIESNCHIEEKRREEKRREKTSLTSVSGDVNPDPALEIYKAYPRHVGKQKALQAINRAVAKLVLEGREKVDAQRFLFQKVKQFAKSPAGNEGQYTPHPASWFNAGQWDDDPAEWQRSRGVASVAEKLEDQLSFMSVKGVRQ